MSEMKPISIRSFRLKAKKNKSRFRRFLSKLDRATPRNLDEKIVPLEKEVWAETDCLSCANCCKTMTPTFNKEDQKRIAAHFKMTVEAFQEKYLRRERGGPKDWLNKVEPCQWLNLKDNKCSIYEIRPADCAGFPHLSKKFKDFAHIHKQNVEYCPATYKLVEKMIERADSL